MGVTRRQVFRLGQTLLAATVIPPKIFGANQAAATLYSKDRFRTLVNSSFAVQSEPAGRSWLVLLSVEDLVPASSSLRSSGPSLDTFVLHFYGSGEPLEQNTYELDHASLGRLSLFIVPGADSKYTATINRFLGAAPYAPPVRQTRPAAAA